MRITCSNIEENFVDLLLSPVLILKKISSIYCCRSFNPLSSECLPGETFSLRSTGLWSPKPSDDRRVCGNRTFQKKVDFCKKNRKINLFCRCCTHTKGTPLDDFYGPTSRGVVDIDQKPLNSYWSGMSPRGDIRRPFYTGFEKYTGFKNIFDTFWPIKGS